MSVIISLPIWLAAIMLAVGAVVGATKPLRGEEPEEGDGIAILFALSGAAGGRFAADLSVPVMGDDWRVEVKIRARDFTRIYAWLADNRALIVRADRHRPLVILPLDAALDILDAAERARAA